MKGSRAARYFSGCSAFQGKDSNLLYVISYGFVIVLNSGYTYEIAKYANPALLSVRFYPDEDHQPEREVDYFRSEAVPFGGSARASV